MKYLSWTYVDAKTGIPCLIASCSHGPANPAVAGLRFGFALESRYPTACPVFYGSCDDDADTSLPGVLEVLDQAGYEQAKAAEMTARRSKMVVTPRQARLALHEHGILNAVEAFVAAGSDALRIEWQYATEIRRTWPPVAEFAAANDLSEAQLDELFELASSL